MKILTREAEAERNLSSRMPFSRATTRPSAGDTINFSPSGVSRSGSRKKKAAKRARRKKKRERTWRRKEGF
jgi:hypothetical protein